MNRLAHAAIATTACAGLMSCGIARNELYAPRPGPVDMSQWSDIPSRAFTVETSDGLALDGHYWPGAAGDRDIFIFFHGRGAHQGVGAKYAQYLLGRGDAVLVASYRGFGGNPGRPGRAGMEKDAAAFIAQARRLAGPDARLWLVGHSLGAAVALDAAAEQRDSGKTDIAGVILIAAFARLADAAPWYTRPFLPDRWDNLRAAARITVPLLIIQGDRDDVIPPESGRALAAATRGPVAYVSLAGETHKPPMQTLGPWLSAAITAMESGRIASLPPLPSGWTALVERP